MAYAKKRKAKRKMVAKKKGKVKKVSSLKKLTYKGLKRRGVRLNPRGDIDGDGVRNSKDCRPFDHRKQGRLHNMQLKRLRKVEERLETKREKEMHKYNDLRDELKLKQLISSKSKSIKGQKLMRKRIMLQELNREKMKLKKIQMANRKLRSELNKLSGPRRASGKIVKSSRSVLKASKAFVNSPRFKQIMRNWDKEADDFVKPHL